MPTCSAWETSQTSWCCSRMSRSPLPLARITCGLRSAFPVATSECSAPPSSRTSTVGLAALRRGRVRPRHLEPLGQALALGRRGTCRREGQHPRARTARIDPRAAESPGARDVPHERRPRPPRVATLPHCDGGWAADGAGVLHRRRGPRHSQREGIALRDRAGSSGRRHGDQPVCSIAQPAAATICKSGAPFGVALCADPAQRCKPIAAGDLTATPGPRRCAGVRVKEPVLGRQKSASSEQRTQLARRPGRWWPDARRQRVVVDRHERRQWQL